MSPYVGQKVRLATGVWGQDLIGMTGTILAVKDRSLLVQWEGFRLANGMSFDEVEAL